MNRFLLIASLVMATAAGCYTDADVTYRAGYVAPAPTMVAVSPGVQVIYDYDYPVFYSNNVYWRYDGGVWYSSRWHDRGWAVNYNVPYTVRGIDRPQAYAHYRGNANVNVNVNGSYNNGGGYNRGVVDHRGPAPVYNGAAQAPVVRDHRTAPAATPVYRPAPAPAVRDHRRH